MKRPLTALATILLVSSMFPAQTRAASAGDLMAETARRFLGSLDDAQRAKATFAFDDAERLNWHWIPRARKGLPLKELTSYQRALAFALLNTGLSDKGYVTAATTMSYEELIRIEEKGTGPVRDPELYYISVFGTPGGDSWGWRWEGHHLSLNYTLKGNKIVSATPFMFGANPATVADGPNKGLRNLADIQDPIYALLASLDSDQKKAAILSDVAPKIPASPAAAKPLASGSDGIDVQKLNGDQKKLLISALEAYVHLFPDEVSADLVEKLKAGHGEGHFAWFGPTDPSKPHAFRLQGPTVFIDFNDEQNNANHIHTFYRNADGDFGATASK
ncbi:DUF3500 domain-containing protein [Paludisphaera rhizosphaerae]|uniref:DUF3500 domain-containing protein n=1 Tax=Paludisphaera rhizosphaerae TaxID=2711216 RepID=UPI0013ECFEC4|nr:DUF3500 domain-containing protein [Paludisphaera rhizosphaerae]